MRHSYIHGPRRIRAPRATPRSRIRFLQAVIALPAVAVLWLTVGLPVLSQMTGAGAGNRQIRNVFFSTEASGGGSGSGGSVAPQTVAAATVSNQVLAAYHAELARAQARARAKARANAKAANPILPQPTPRTHAPGMATLATADTTSAPPPQQTSSSPPAKDKSPGTGSSGGSSNTGGTTSPGNGGTGTTPPPSPAPGGADTGGSTGDIGRSGGAGGVTPPPPPSPPPPSGSLIPQDIQTTNGGLHNGVVEQNDAVTFTFTSTVDPSQILVGWDGSATAVTVRMTPSGTQNDGMTVLDGSGDQIAALGSVNLHGHYVSAITLFTSSTMTASGSTVTIFLGARSHGVPTENSPSTMVWTTPSGSAPESGPADIDFYEGLAGRCSPGATAKPS